MYRFIIILIVINIVSLFSNAVAASLAVSYKNNFALTSTIVVGLVSLINLAFFFFLKLGYKRRRAKVDSFYAQLFKNPLDIEPLF